MTFLLMIVWMHVIREAVAVSKCVVASGRRGCAILAPFSCFYIKGVLCTFTVMRWSWWVRLGVQTFAGAGVEIKNCLLLLCYIRSSVALPTAVSVKSHLLWMWRIVVYIYRRRAVAFFTEAEFLFSNYKVTTLLRLYTRTSTSSECNVDRRYFPSLTSNAIVNERRKEWVSISVLMILPRMCTRACATLLPVQLHDDFGIYSWILLQSPMMQYSLLRIKKPHPHLYISTESYCTYSNTSCGQ